MAEDRARDATRNEGGSGMSMLFVELGDKERFAVRIELLPDPDKGHYASPEEALSWGRFDLWVQGRN